MSSESEKRSGIIADCHMHYYPCYDWPTFLARLRGNLGQGHGHTVHVAFFTEGSAFDYFTQIRNGSMPDAGAQITIPEGDPNTVYMEFGRGTPPLFLFAGRQIITQERLEILSLMVHEAVPDNMPAMETVAQVLEIGGLAVLPWAPGKWTLQRKSAVRALLRAYRPGQLFLGDSTLRPTYMPEPKIMQWAVSKGFGVLAGSDPLPVKGEERYAGSYGIELSGSIDACHPARSVREMIHEASRPIQAVGQRCSPPVVARRIAFHEWTKRVLKESV